MCRRGDHLVTDSPSWQSPVPFVVSLSDLVTGESPSDT